ncbi:MAG: SulP family inorganic anion transporter [Dehalococcoidia bacterium]|nr:SulP family inorganic anion transporter [Dehalococcoidia bacterium]
MPRDEVLRNVIAGAIVGVIAFPLSIALAVAVGVSPIAGLYTAVFAGGTAAALGGSRFNITGPTAALVPLLLQVVVSHGVRALPVAAFLAGIFLVLMGLLRFGRLIRFMPHLVIVGFTAGIGVSIAFGQVNNLLGLSDTDAQLVHFHERVMDTVAHLGTIEPASAVIGLLSVVFLLVYQARPRRIPGALLVVVVATVAAIVLDLKVATVSNRYGALPTSIPTPSFDFLDFGLAMDLVPAAAAIAVLAAVESLLSAVVADGMAADGVRHDADRELVGQGVGNLVAPVFGGIPATAAIARTAAGVRSGATSRLAGVVHAGMVLALTVVLASVAGDIPLAALAAILVVVAYRIADVPELVRLIRTAPREDLLALVGTVLVTVFLDLTFAIALGVLTSTVLLLRRLHRIPVVASILDGAEAEAGENDYSPELKSLVRDYPNVLFYNAQGVLSFHSAAALEASLPRQDPRPLVIRMRDIHHVDSSGLMALQAIVEQRERAGGRTLLTGARPEVEAVLRRFGLGGALGPAEVSPTSKEALRATLASEREKHAASTSP